MVQNAGNRLIKAIGRQVDKIDYFCSVENISVNLIVHELRKSFKRLRSLLRFYNGLPGNNVSIIREEIRNFGRMLAPLRESAVNVDLFEKKIAGNILLPERKTRITKEMLIKKNKYLLEKELYDNDLFNIVCNYFNRFETLLKDAVSEQPLKVHFYREVCQSYRKGYTIYIHLPDEPHPEELHSLRKKLKRLFYQLDFIRFYHPRYFKLKTDQLNKITDYLGNDHDLHIFLQELTLGEYEFDSEELYILSNQVNHLRELNGLKLFPSLKQFFTVLPDEFDQKLELYFKL